MLYLNKPLFIVFEGLDGSGKSTIAKEVSKIINAKTIKTPPKQFDNIRNALDYYYQDCSEGSRFFYLSTLFFASNIIKHELKNNNSIIADRYWMSTCVYNDSIINDKDLKKYSDLLIKPDITFFLNVSKEARLERLMNRVNVTNSDIKSIKNDEKLFIRYMKFFKTIPNKKKYLVNNEQDVCNSIKKILMVVKNVQKKSHTNLCKVSLNKSLSKQMPILSQ
jgi:dTMP kinase